MKSFRRRRLYFFTGWLASFLALLAFAELSLTWVPPADLQLYLGEESNLTGYYKPDPNYGLTYASWPEFESENRFVLERDFARVRSEEGRGAWVFFGNSFVQAPGMLADTARDRLPGKLIFNLGRNTPLPIRFAQVELLLNAGMRAERIFFEVMPTDTQIIGHFPLASHFVTAEGALTYRPNLQNGVLGNLARHSRVALSALVRTNQHRVNASYSLKTKHESIVPALMDDLQSLFHRLACVTQDHNIPVTVLLVPEHNQVVQHKPFGFQDDITSMLTELGFDVFDPRLEFQDQADLAALYIPDKHLSNVGNRLLLDCLLTHLDRLRPSTETASTSVEDAEVRL